MAADAVPPLDAKVIGELRELQESGSPGLLAELIDLFLKQTAEKFEEVRTACAAKDGPAVARIAHTLKGSGGSLGAMHLSGLCKGLENAVRGNDWTAAARSFSEIEAEFARVRAALEAERNR